MRRVDRSRVSTTGHGLLPRLEECIHGPTICGVHGRVGIHEGFEEIALEIDCVR